MSTVPQPSDEIVLDGGNTNEVVRVGETVRRQTGPHSQTVHAYLQHLEARGVPAPRFLGIDDHGREILSFIEGETGIPRSLWEGDEALLASIKLLRRLHDASLDFVAPQPANWAFSSDASRADRIICHHDFAPYNMVFKDGIPIAILDFDLCGPGSRQRDLAYLTYWMAPLSFSSHDLSNLSEQELATGCPRLKLMCASYGEERLDQILQLVSETLHHMASETAMRTLFGDQTVAKLKRDGHLAHWTREAEAFDARLDQLLESVVG